MFEALLADPCRFAEILLDPRSLRRLWRTWRRRGTAAILAEISNAEDLRSAGAPLTRIIPAGGASSAGGILVIDATLPQYDRDAGGRSSFLYLTILRQMGYDVFFMPNDQVRREPYASALEEMGVKVVAGRGFRCSGWRSWLRGKDDRITHVILHRPNVAWRYLAAIRKMGGFSIFYFAHDLRSVREARQYEVSGDKFHLCEARYWERIEKTILAQVDRAYFFSTEETHAVSAWDGGANACTVPLFPVNLQPCPGLPYAQRSGLLFVGGFSHQPNQDAVLWFAQEVFPIIRKALPNIEWRIVGREPPLEIQGLAGNGILVEGAVSEAHLENLYQTSRLVVAPLRFGAGMKGKVVEAMNQGVPVVTTPVGAEGIPNGDAILCVGESGEDMARQIIQIYQDASLWGAKRSLVIQGASRFSREAAVQRLTEDLCSAPP